MKRRQFLKHVGAGMAATAVAAPAVVQAQAMTKASPSIRWRMASSFPKSLDALYGSADRLAARVSKLTDGRFEIRVFAAGEIVPPLQVLDAVQNGTVECGQTAGYYYIGKNPAFAFDTALPFGLTCRQQNAWMYSGGGLELMRGLYRRYDIVNFPGGNTGTQMAGWYRREINSVADLQGLKFRIGGLGGQVLARLGVVAQQIGGPDIYPALEKGTIDAAEWVGPYDDEKLGFHKVAKYYYYPGWWEGSAQLSILVNVRQWQALPAAYREALEVACAEANVQMTAHYDANNTAALRRLVAEGAQLRAFPRVVLEACHQAAQELYAELAVRHADFGRIYAAWSRFRSDQYLWFRVAENTFENFVYSEKAPVRARK